MLWSRRDTGTYSGRQSLSISPSDLPRRRLRWRGIVSLTPSRVEFPSPSCRHCALTNSCRPFNDQSKLGHAVRSERIRITRRGKARRHSATSLGREAVIRPAASPIHTSYQKLNSWRRGRDSNPRYGFPYTHFPGVRLRPLGHPSVLGSVKRTQPRRILPARRGRKRRAPRAVDGPGRMRRKRK
jgi:hypothetical protein